MAGWSAADCCVLWPGKAELEGRENLGFWCVTGWGWNVDLFCPGGRPSRSISRRSNTGGGDVVDLCVEIPPAVWISHGILLDSAIELQWKCS